MSVVRRVNKHIVKATIVDDPRVYALVRDVIEYYCGSTLNCDPNRIDVPEAVVAIFTSNCRDWHDELFESLGVMASVSGQPFKIEYYYNTGEELLCVEEVCRKPGEYPEEVRNAVYDIYDALRAECRQ